MKKLVILIFCLLILSVTPIFSCSCDTIDKDAVESLMKEVDYILIGKATSNLYHSDYLTQFHNSRESGTNVLFEIDSVIKGDADLVKGKVFIYQFGGNCDRVFDFDETYLVFGRKINTFKEVGYDEDNAILKEGVLTIHAEKEKVSFLKEQTKKLKIITTGYCVSFYTNSKAYSQIETYLENE